MLFLPAPPAAKRNQYQSASGDSFYFVSTPVTGDGNITAHLTGATGGVTGDGEKVGVMIREDLDTNSAHATIYETDTNWGLTYTRRDAKGSDTSPEAGFAPRYFPIWLRMQREGNNLTGYYSWDGQLWIPTVTRTVTMGANANYGLAISSHDDSVTMTTQWDAVSVNPGQVQVAGLEACGNDNGVMLTWNRQSPGGKLRPGERRRLCRCGDGRHHAARRRNRPLGRPRRFRLPEPEGDGQRPDDGTDPDPVDTGGRILLRVTVPCTPQERGQGAGSSLPNNSPASRPIQAFGKEPERGSEG